jgi:hypothetical protein
VYFQANIRINSEITFIRLRGILQLRNVKDVQETQIKAVEMQSKYLEGDE